MKRSNKTHSNSSALSALLMRTSNNNLEMHTGICRLPMVLGAAAVLLTATAAFAGNASTSASAGSNGRGPGTATATAQYNGTGPGFADTRTRSGLVSFGRGIAYGVDEHGITFSASNAVAGRFGAAVASTFNLSIGFDGSVSSSGGVSVAKNSPVRIATAGGFARTGSAPAVAAATAGGHTGPAGTVRANTYAHSTPRRVVWR
jgi:hypothetical protein